MTGRTPSDPFRPQVLVYFNDTDRKSGADRLDRSPELPSATLHRRYEFVNIEMAGDDAVDEHHRRENMALAYMIRLK